MLLQSGIDRVNHTIYLIGEVNDEMYKTAVYGLTALQQAEDITIVLNTYGGEFYQSLAIYDLFKFSEKKIKVVCNGPVMSAGIIILQGGTERVAFPNSQLMVHYGEDSNESVDDIKHNTSMLKLMKNIIAERSNVGLRKINSWFKNDTYFSVDEAIKYGLIDRVAGQK